MKSIVSQFAEQKSFVSAHLLQPVVLLEIGQLTPVLFDPSCWE